MKIIEISALTILSLIFCPIGGVQRKGLMKSLFGSLLSLGIEERLGNLTC
jgi:hypothetical protein